jgi:hypothetical protein
MNAYKKYCNRRAAQKEPETEQSHCCPSRMPIIGPILFSLFIFSPFILPTSEPDKLTELASDSTVEEPLLPTNDPSSIQKTPTKEPRGSKP